jgi:GGDEF domain-containing protein
LAGQREADQFVRSFREELDLLNKQENRAFNVEASSGTVVIRLDEYSTIEECIQKSDEEMYRQKENRKKETN